MNTGIVCCVLLMICLVVGCSDEHVIDWNLDAVPTVHLFPSWYGIDQVVFQNIGAYKIGRDWVDINEAWAGIVVYDIDSGDYRLVIPGGWYTSTSRSDDLVASLLGGVDGPVVVYDGTSFTEVVESHSWNARGDVAINDDGSLVAWRSYGSDHAIGVWIFNVAADDYMYLGSGGHPAWKPNSSTLLYRADDLAERTWLVEYDCVGAQRDTIYEFPEESSGRVFTYAPTGDRVAYFRIGLSSEGTGICVLNLETFEEELFVNHTGFGLCWGSRGVVYSNSCTDFDDEGCGVLWLLDLNTGVSAPLTERLQFTW